jgi:acyl dehydratase
VATLFLEDFIPGSVTPYGGATVDRDAMLAFAQEFDAQPMHVDDQAARGTMAGQLIASGWFTAALNMRMMADDFILETASMGSPGVSELKWLKPVLAGDRLRGIRHVLGRRPSASRPDRGLVNFRFEVLNQHDEVVLEQTNLIMIARRSREPLAEGAAAQSPDDEPTLPAFRDVTQDMLPYFDDLVVGDRLDLGALTFTQADIIRFARAYDPQYFHLDAQAARSSIFGGLIASGWHTGAGWMGRMVSSRMAAAAMATGRGERPARLGPSPGFRNLRWIKPVHAGDVIRYSSAIYEMRASASRPGWGLVRHYNTGVNQRDETVFSFIGSVFWERRPSP